MLKQSKNIETVDLFSAEAKHFFSLSPDLMILLDYEGNVLMINNAWTVALGYSMEELMKEKTMQTIHPLDGEKTLALYKTIIEGKNLEVDYEDRKVCKDGNYKWYAWNFVADPIKELVYGIGRDVSLQKEQSEQIQQDEIKFHFLSDHNLQAISVCIDGRIETVNKAFEELSGYSESELIGKDCMDLVAEKWREYTDKMIDCKYDLPYESEIITKDGSIVAVELIAKDIIYKNQEARISLITNIDSQKAAAEKIKHTENRFNSLFKSSPVGISIINDHYDLLEINPVIAAKLNYELETLKKMDILEIVHPEEIKRVRKQLLRIFSKEQQTVEIETRLIKNGGDAIWVKLMISLINITKKETNAVVFMESIDKRKFAEFKLEEKNEELLRINQELEHFAYVASHDLQEPLRTITSFIQILERKYSNILDDDGRQFMGYITDGTRRMQNLIRDLLAYSRVNRQSTGYEEVDLNEVFEAVNQALNNKINENDAIILAENLPVIQGNKIQLIQIFQNFIDNAIKFRGKKSPEIIINVKELSDKWEISIEDNGIGISPEFHQRIFIIFQRLHTMDEYSGTGIGLAMCKKIIERHGGEVWVDSKADKGTKFIFTIAKNLIGPAA